MTSLQLPFPFMQTVQEQKPRCSLVRLSREFNKQLAGKRCKMLQSRVGQTQVQRPSCAASTPALASTIPTQGKPIKTKVVALNHDGL